MSRSLSAFLAHYRIRITFFVAAALLLQDWWEGTRPHDPTNWADPLGVSGAVLVLLGALMRSWAAGIVHKNDVLATGGPYSLTRHPLYVGSFAIALGFCVAIGDLEDLVGVAVLFLVLYLPKIVGEERSLSEIFGERWQAYTRTTGRFFPRTLLPRVGAPWSWRRWADNREYRAFAASLLGLVILTWVARLPYGP